MYNEDSHLNRIFGKRVPAPGGWHRGRRDSPERKPDFIMWMYPLLGDDDRENMTRIQQMVLPPEAFAGVKQQLIQRAIGDDWRELTRRMPELTA